MGLPGPIASSIARSVVTGRFSDVFAGGREMHGKDLVTRLHSSQIGDDLGQIERGRLWGTNIPARRDPQHRCCEQPRAFTEYTG